MGLVIFIKKMKVIIKNIVYFIKKIVVQCRKYWGHFTNKTKRYIFLFFIYLFIYFFSQFWGL